MTETLKAIEVDCSTGAVTERELTAEEIAQRAADAAAFEAKRLADEAEAQRIADLKASAKAKLVSGQPLTEEEASVLTF
mgnify:CR=1 FL=1